MAMIRIAILIVPLIIFFTSCYCDSPEKLGSPSQETGNSDPNQTAVFDDGQGQCSIVIDSITGNDVLMEGSEASFRCDDFSVAPVPTEYPIGQYVDLNFYWSCDPPDAVEFLYDQSPVLGPYIRIRANEVDEDTEAQISFTIDSPDHIAETVSFPILIRNRQMPPEWELNLGQYFTTEIPMCDPSGNVFVFGNFRFKDVDFDPGPGEAIRSPIYTQAEILANDTKSTTYYLTKFSGDGTFQWVKIICEGLAQHHHSDIDFKIDSFGNLYILGGFQGVVDLDPGDGEEIHGSNQRDYQGTFLSKFDNEGNFLWTRVWGEGTTTNFMQRALATDGDGNIYIAGNFLGSVSLGLDGDTCMSRSADRTAFCLIKLTTYGEYVWAKTWGEGSRENYFYNFDEIDYLATTIDIESDDNGNIFYTGMFSGTRDMDSGPAEVVRTSKGLSDIFLSKFSPSGDLLWCNTYGSTQDDYAFGLDVIGNERVVLGGLFQEFIDFNPGDAEAIETASQSPMWADRQIMGPPDERYSGINTGSAFIAAYTIDGDFEWVRSWRSECSNRRHYLDFPFRYGDLACDSCGNTIVTGMFHGIVDFDPGLSVYDVSAFDLAYRNLYMSLLGPDGNFISVDTWTVEGALDTSAYIATDIFGNTYVGSNHHEIPALRKNTTCSSVAGN
jgi:hypothetical protein